VPGLPEAMHAASGCPMAAQLAALQQLLPRLEALPSVRSASINRSSVPIIALTATLPAANAGGAADGASVELQLDISLHSEIHAGLPAAQHVRMLHSLLPALQPLVLTLKQLLHRHGLKSAFTGGLSSYALVVLVSRFLLDRHALKFETLLRPSTAARNAAADSADATGATNTPLLPPGAYTPLEQRSLGGLLLECMHFIGTVFDPQRHAVWSGRRPTRQHGPLIGTSTLEYGFVCRDSSAELDAFALQPLVCADPVLQGNNVGKTCYRIGQIQRLFREAAAAALEASESAACRLEAVLAAASAKAEEAHGSNEAARALSVEVGTEVATAEAQVIEALFSGGNGSA